MFTKGGLGRYIGRLSTDSRGKRKMTVIRVHEPHKFVYVEQKDRVFPLSCITVVSFSFSAGFVVDPQTERVVQSV